MGSAHAQAPADIIANVIEPASAGVFEVVVMSSPPRTLPLIVRDGKPTHFSGEELKSAGAGLNGVLWLLFLSPNLVSHLQMRALDDTRQIEMGRENQLRVRYGTSPSLVIDFESNALVRVDVEHDGHLWTVIWDEPMRQKSMRILRNSAPFAMISQR